MVAIATATRTKKTTTTTNYCKYRSRRAIVKVTAKASLVLLVLNVLGLAQLVFAESSLQVLKVATAVVP